MSAPTVSVAVLETFKYTFTAVGRNSDEAFRNLRKGWNTHRRNLKAGGIEVSPWSEWENDVNIMEFGGGVCCLRDGESIPGLKTEKKT